MLNGKPALHLRFSGNQIGKALNLKEIQLSIVESATRKLTRCRLPKVIMGTEFSVDGINDSATSVQMKLQNIFASK